MDVSPVATLAVVNDIGPKRPGSSVALEAVASRPIAHHVLRGLESVGVSQVLVVSSVGRARHAFR